MADRPGPNDTLPHGTDTARRTHLAHGEVLCPLCGEVDALVRHGIDPQLVNRIPSSARQEVASGDAA